MTKEEVEALIEARFDRIVEALDNAYRRGQSMFADDESRVLHEAKREVICEIRMAIIATKE